MKIYARALCLLAMLLSLPLHAATHKYQYEQDQLFQSIPTDFTPSRLQGGAPYDWRGIGATATHVDKSTGWAWKNIGGDWIDRDGVPQGSAHWITFGANAVSGATASSRYSVDVTSLLRQVRSTGTWNAFILKPGAVGRTIAGAKHIAAPVISVVYTDGTAEALSCLYSTRLTTSTVFVSSNSPTHALPAVLEFEKPKKAVSSAVLLLTVTSHPFGKSAITGNLLNPPINKHPVVYGLAKDANPLDAGLIGNTKIIGVHRYLDSAKREDFISNSGLNIYAERDFDPFIWGRGPHDYTKLPHRDLGKWVAAKDNFQLVKSDYRGEGFRPLAPGLGAMKVTMPAAPGLKDGSVVGFIGTTGSIAKIYLPEPDFGVLDTLYIRYYLRFGEPLENHFSNRYQVYKIAGSTPFWTDMAGKTGITPSHDGTYGGYSGTSGGGFGWQMRMQWADRVTDFGPPTGGATTMGVHTFDFGFNNPFGHKYGDGKLPHMLGAEGGLGGVMWPGQWYCIEMKINMNTVMPTAPGYLADGDVEIFVDGRLALKMSNMVMRSLPLVKKEYRAGYLRPARQLGVRDLNFNWYHGGTTKNPIDRSIFVTGLAWGHEYIGPMTLGTTQ